MSGSSPSNKNFINRSNNQQNSSEERKIQNGRFGKRESIKALMDFGKIDVDNLEVSNFLSPLFLRIDQSVL